MTVKIVKSAARIFEILELFNQTKQAMPAIEIASRLDYPLASTHELLKTMTGLGYFTYGDPKWTYKPSHRLPLVVDWVRDSVTENRRLSDFMTDLNETTRETINLSRQLRSEVKIIKGMECLYEIGVSSKPGTQMPVTKSLTGLTSLAALSVTHLEAYFEELAKNDPLQYSTINFERLDNVREELKAKGTVLACDLFVDGIGAICFPLSVAGSNQIFVIGIVGPSERIKTAALSHQRLIRRLVKEHQVNTPFKIKSLKP